MVKTGQRPPPKAARSGLDDREHGATLKQVGNIAAAGPLWLATFRADNGLPPAHLRLLNGRKSHQLEI